MGDASPVYVLRLMCPPGELVFHLPGDHAVEAGQCPDDPMNTRWVARAVCGRVAFLAWCKDHDAAAAGWQHRDRRLDEWLRRDQAELLGRLCKRCEAADG